uniref:Uncharacterized protein n=1 Tax=Cacopsylla melanoneura TaxID=428564 RepID=A0A8D8SE73_9HEMI
MATFFNRPFDYLPRRSSKTAHQNFAIDMSNESSNPYLKLSRFELIGRRDKSQDKLSIGIFLNLFLNEQTKNHRVYVFLNFEVSIQHILFIIFTFLHFFTLCFKFNR